MMHSVGPGYAFSLYLPGGMQRRFRLSGSSHISRLSHWHMPHRYLVCVWVHISASASIVEV